MLRNRLRVTRKPKSDKQYTPLTWIEALSMCGQYIRVHMHIACVECHIHINQTYTHTSHRSTHVLHHTQSPRLGATRAPSRIFSGLPLGTPRSRHALHRFVTMHVFMHRTYNCIHITVTRRRSCAVYIHPMRGHLRRIAGALGQATRPEDDPGQPCMCAHI